MASTTSIDTSFSVRLYDALARAQPGDNLFLSPFSIQAALAMVGVGARGETRRVLAGLIGAPEDVDEQNRRYAAWNSAVKADIAGHVALAVANALWGQQGLSFKPAYRRAIAEFYEGAFNEVDFQSAPEQAVATINSWVAGKTGGKIPTLLTREHVGRSTRLIVTNAIYFKGRWENAFDAQDTLDEDWHGSAGVRKVPMMQQRRDFYYCETDDFQALDIPYQGQGLSMLIILPRKTDGLAALESMGAAAQTYRQATDALTYEKKVIVSLPRFKTTSAFELKPVLSSLGAGQLFSDSADFSGMADEPLQLSDVVHKAFVEVNEEGTEAAAATAAVAFKGGPASQPKVFLADHPFLCFIRHRKSNAILFCGRVLEPA